MAAVKKKTIRFNAFQDIMLLREVLSLNPFNQMVKTEAKLAWDAIAANVSIYAPGVSSRTCKERTLRLINVFRSEDRAILKRSGTEEQFEEKEQLLQEISDLENEGKELVTKQEESKQQQLMKETAAIADVNSAAISNTLCSTPFISNNSVLSPLSESNNELNSDEDDFPPTLKRSRMGGGENDLEDYLNTKNIRTTKINEAELALRREELRLWNRKMDLEESRLQLDREKWQLEQERWQVEKEEKIDRKMLLDLVKLVLASQKK